MEIWDRGERDMTQNEIILWHLRERGSITNMEAFAEYNITRLSGRIHELRQQGCKITTTKEKARNGAIYGVYRLEKGEG